MAIPAANAALSFNFDYSMAPDFNATSKASLESAAATVGGWFGHTATIEMKVTSSNANTSTLASAGSNPSSSAPVSGFGNRGVVGTKILSNGATDSNGATADGTVDVNFFHNWDFDDNVDAGAFDFKSTMMHELLHAVGFLSNIGQTGSDAVGQDSAAQAANGGFWGPFDQFVADSSGRLIAQTANFGLDQSRWNTASIGGTGSTPPANGLYFDGANAKAANGGNAVPLYSPNPWEDGSSGSHLDDNFFTGANQKLMNAATNPGPGVRTLSAIEEGILKDLGFTLASGGGGAAVPEPGFALALLLAGGGAFLRRRKCT